MTCQQFSQNWAPSIFLLYDCLISNKKLGKNYWVISDRQTGFPLAHVSKNKRVEEERL